VLKGGGGTIAFFQRPTALETVYLSDLQSVFRPRWVDNGFYATFYAIKSTPIMQRPISIISRARSSRFTTSPSLLDRKGERWRHAFRPGPSSR
jgi:hypothetical protein